MENLKIIQPPNNLLPNFKTDYQYIELESNLKVEILPEILFITSFPPRECGIAAYSQDLIRSLNNKFNHTFKMSICALENNSEKHHYTLRPKYKLNTDIPLSYVRLAKNINEDDHIKMAVIQHEFGFFHKNENDLLNLFKLIKKPVVIVFHTVLPAPNAILKHNVQQLIEQAASIIVMTKSSAQILAKDYGVLSKKITVIPHGTHLVPKADKEILKLKHNFQDKFILSTFGLINDGKSIETTLYALPDIIKKNPKTLFLIIGKTHPSVVKYEGEKYRDSLMKIVKDLEIEEHVLFLNYFLSLTDLLEYLQLTDIYLFTSKDPNQAVSGTFSYAISCGCPVVSTPIPHAKEILQNDTGLIFDFQDSKQLANCVIQLLNDDNLRNEIGLSGFHKMASTAWENSAISHAILFEKIAKHAFELSYKIPDVNLNYIKKLTTDFGIIQFSKLCVPDIESGYTLDDNARALIAMCQNIEISKNNKDLGLLKIYFEFIKYCQQMDGNFLNYVNEAKEFTPQNYTTNLEDSNGRAIWALGFLISKSKVLPTEYQYLCIEAETLIQKAIKNIRKNTSTRAMAFLIKGLYFRNQILQTEPELNLITELADRLVQMYRHEADADWLWFESYLTYGNSILPEAMLCAYLATGNQVYKEVAKSTFDFLLSKIFHNNHIQVVSNKGWLHRSKEPTLPKSVGGEQPIDVAYAIIALQKFYEVFNLPAYQTKITQSFNWFLGANHLHQIIYNPTTGGCYDGLEEHNVNLNQGAESTVSYLMARLTLHTA